MTKLLSYITILGCLILTTGCLQTVKLTPDVTSDWGKVAVTSNAGSKLNFAYVGTTAFNNSYVTKNLDDAQVDRRLSDDVSKTLRKKGIDAEMKQNLSPILFEPKDSKYALDKVDFNAVKEELGADSSYTHLIVLSGGSYPPVTYAGDPIGGSNQTLSGIGLYQRSFLNIKDPPSFYVVALVRIYDLRTEEAVTARKQLEHRKTNLESFPKQESEVKEDKAALFLNQNYDLILKAFDKAAISLF
ncbi:MAG: hypothetical protein AAF546_13180 [Verrucomicrobiota bacterium]